MAPYIMLGFLFAGFLHVFIKPRPFIKYFGQNNFRSVVYAAIFGIPLPLCSCGVIPTGISLKKHGASDGATVSFLIATPQTGVDSIMATWSLIGLPFAIIRIVVAFFTALAGGILVNMFKNNVNNKDSVYFDKDPIEIEKSNLENPFLKMLKYAFFDFIQDIAKWLVIGLAVAALISLLIPDNFFVKYIGNQYLEMLMILIVSIPLYICATGSIPIAAMLLMKGMSPGAALIFLMAGPATNAATITVLGNKLGSKTLILYLISITTGAYLSGLLINNFFSRDYLLSSINMKYIHTFHLHNSFSWFSIICAMVFSILTLYSLLVKYNIIKMKRANSDNKSINMNSIEITVKGMTCSHCKANVENNLKKISGIENVSADLVNNKVKISGDSIKLDEVEKTITSLGYQFVGKAE